MEKGKVLKGQKQVCYTNTSNIILLFFDFNF